MNDGCSQKMIKKVLIINRSEVALRIQSACKALGIQTVAVYSSDDAGARYVHAADESYELSGRGFSAYTNQNEVLGIASKAGVDAIHPGYGFLAENAQFASRVIDSGLIWIGPSPDAMAVMGDKIQARKLAESVGVPVVPGMFISLQDLDNLAQAHTIAAMLGFPIIIKDPLAGGGKAMRKVLDATELDAAWGAVVSEASRMTGSKELLLEKYLEQGRHVEVQIAGDGDKAVHFFERECSIQRRHQKIVEEAPCLFVSQDVLDKMYEAAITLARAVNYKSIGTVEFMVVSREGREGTTRNEDSFYFLEMNTRLQVEHSVTEMTTGVDLVALQLEVAQTGLLPYCQEDIRRHGHAIECRIYAEDPSNNFAPSTGVITHLQLPNGPWLRHDHDLEEFKEITPFFDAMIAKVTTYGPTRLIALGYMLDVLRQYVIGGIATNITFLQRLLATEIFKSGAFDTQTLKDPLLTAQLNEVFIGSDCDISALIALALSQALHKEQQLKAAQETYQDIPNISNQVNLWKEQQWK